jgi:phage tail-like protein
MGATGRFRVIIAGMQREISYSQFNFLLQFGDESETQAGFQECSGLGLEMGLPEYRDGNEPTQHVRKITGLHKTTDVTLKRGVVNGSGLSSWLEAVRSGDNPRRDIVVMLQSEDGTETAQTWRLKGARIVKCTGDLLNAKGEDIAIEELVLNCEGIEAG